MWTEKFVLEKHAKSFFGNFTVYFAIKCLFKTECVSECMTNTIIYTVLIWSLLKGSVLCTSACIWLYLTLWKFFMALLTFSSLNWGCDLVFWSKCDNTGFPLFRTDKFPWFSRKFPSYFWINVYTKLHLNKNVDLPFLQYPKNKPTLTAPQHTRHMSG